MKRSEELLRRREAVVPRGLPRITPVVAERGRGATLVDVDGREYLDFATGIGVNLLGHCHDAAVRAAQEQVARLQHTCIHVATYEPYVALCEALARRFPHGPSTKVLLLNSGAEAVENAVKIARQKTGRPAVLCFGEAFHGRTLLCMTLTSKVATKAGCGPYAPEVYRLPFPNHFRDGDGLDAEAFARRELRRLREAFVGVVPAEQVAAVVVEVVQGEGGFVPCPPEYLRGLRALCDQHGILLVCDEVQSGFGRTGRWAAYEHAGVTPDLSTWAKAMGGGLPISAVVGRADVMDAARPGTIGGTYGGNPVACASALATLRELEALDVPARARALGAVAERRLRALAARCPLVADVRGLGAMLAVELCHGGDPGRPAGEAAKAVADGCLARGLIVLTAAPHGNVLRLLPPLTLSDEELERGLGIIEEQVLRVAGAQEVAAAANPAEEGGA